MPNNAAARINPLTKISNLLEYVHSKEVRLNTSLIGGKIIYEGKEYSEDEYNAAFPEPVLKYDSVQLDGSQIEKWNNMPYNKTLLSNAVNIIDDQVKELEEELSYLRAAKKNLESLIDKPATPLPKTKKEGEVWLYQFCT